MTKRKYLQGSWILFLFALFAFLACMSLTRPASAENADEAKRHFTNGVHLFEDRNFAGALVEFEASFQLNRTAAALQNIAVCQKGLFRYAEAIATLERMLKDFGPQLTPDDKKAAEDAIREMSALLGTVVLKVVPADARVSINESPVAPEALKSPVRLAAGEYRLAVEAPGYARQERVISVVSGQKDRTVEITLVPLSGTLIVRAHDSEAAIAIDGVQVGYDEWKGPASAGPHEIYVYTSKLRHKSSVIAYAGQTTEFDAKLTPSDALPADQPAAPGPPPYVPPSQRGIYGFLMFGADTMGSTSPTGLNQDKARTGGTFGGITFGYRFSTGFAAEFQAETADHQIAACRAIAARNGCAGSELGNYALHSSRIGPAVRFMTSGRKGRFVGTIGVGAAVHTLSFDKTLTASHGDTSSVGSFLSLAGGYELNLGHFLFDAGLRLVVETGDEAKSGGLKSAGSGGLELRVGYGQW